jgi:cardiolipin synthase
MSLGTVIFWLLLLNYLAVPLVVCSVLLRRKEPASLAAWCLLVITVPFFGMFLYWVLGSERIPRRARRRAKRIKRLSARLLHRIQTEELVARDDFDIGLAPPLAEIERLGRRLAHMPGTAGNQVELINDTQLYFERLAELIRSAQRHLHLTYYIWNDDDTGREFRQYVIDAAQRGVECRIILDAAGAFSLKRSFLKPLTDAGVEVRFFLPQLIHRRRLTVNFRNHRKIAIADGAVGLIGSQNIGDEYRGRDPNLPVWIDTNLRLVGPSVLYLQEVFAEDWFFCAKKDLSGPQYFPPPSTDGQSIVQILPTGPDQTSGALEHVLFAAVAEARETIRIVTPYFVPDRAMRAALRHAALRGVRVELIVSQVTDVIGIIWASRSYYAELLDVGVNIYEWPLGMLHSKFMTIDDQWMMVGSANIDVRSFRLNFEATALVYDQQITQAAGEWFAARREESEQMTLEEVYGWPLRSKLALGLARLVSPVL